MLRLCIIIPCNVTIRIYSLSGLRINLETYIHSMTSLFLLLTQSNSVNSSDKFKLSINKLRFPFSSFMVMKWTWILKLFGFGPVMRSNSHYGPCWATVGDVADGLFISSIERKNRTGLIKARRVLDSFMQYWIIKIKMCHLYCFLKDIVLFSSFPVLNYSTI